MKLTNKQIIIKATVICAIAVLADGVCSSGGDSDWKSAPTVTSAAVTATSVPAEATTTTTESVIETTSVVVSLRTAADYNDSKV